VRNIIIAGNWKMHKTQAESQEFLKQFKPLVEESNPGREVVLCAPFTALGVMSQILHGSRIRLGAQNIHWEEQGAYTGEISGAMLLETGVQYVVVGHSERRQYFAETDESVNKKLHAALAHGLTPILCVGETLAQNQGGETQAIVSMQVEAALQGLSAEQVHTLVIAY